MKTLSPDTHPEAEKVLIELLRKTPAWRKLEMVSQITTTCRELALSGLRRRHPTSDEEELKKRLAALVLPRQMVIRAYNWDPERAGY
ncbi:MAG: hypothetical protein QME81_02600 [bacterium]|nr:hypothetical protein [bacterium]